MATNLKITFNKKHGHTHNIYFTMDNYSGRMTGGTKFGNVISEYPHPRFMLKLDNSIESNEFRSKTNGLAKQMLDMAMEDNIIHNGNSKPCIDTTYIEVGTGIKLLLVKLYHIREHNKLVPAGDKLGNIKFENGRSEIEIYKEVAHNSNNYTTTTVPIYNYPELHKYPGLYNVKYRIAGLSVNDAGPELKYSLIIMAVGLIKIEKKMAVDTPIINGQVPIINSEKEAVESTINNNTNTDDAIDINDEEVQKLLSNLNPPKPVEPAKKPIINGFRL